MRLMNSWFFSSTSAALLFFILARAWLTSKLIASIFWLSCWAKHCLRYYFLSSSYCFTSCWSLSVLSLNSTLLKALWASFTRFFIIWFISFNLCFMNLSLSDSNLMLTKFSSLSSNRLSCNFKDWDRPSSKAALFYLIWISIASAFFMSISYLVFFW